MQKKNLQKSSRHLIKSFKINLKDDVASMPKLKMILYIDQRTLNKPTVNFMNSQRSYLWQTYMGHAAAKPHLRFRRVYPINSFWGFLCYLKTAKRKILQKHLSKENIYTAFVRIEDCKLSSLITCNMLNF